jgi:uncharacterized protein YndB with AHSA1/START domain
VIWLVMLIGALCLLVTLIAVVGALLPKGHVAARAAVYRRPPEEVFDAVHGFAAYPEWRSDAKSVEVLPPVDGKERFREHGRHGPITFEVDEAVRPRRMIVRIADTNLPFGGSWTYELSPAPGGTRLTITERGEVSNVFFRFLSRFVFSQHATIDTMLAALGRKFGETTTPANP